MSTYLDDIVAAKREEVDLAKADTPVEKLREQSAAAPPPRDFLGALSQGPPIRLIAEVKKASPSAGIIRADFDPANIAQIYQEHGASCISVLTDKPYFQGSLEDLRQVARRSICPCCARILSSTGTRFGNPARLGRMPCS